MANSSDFCLFPAMTKSPVTLWVIVPFTLDVLSTLNTDMEWGIGSKGSFDCRAKDLSMKSPFTPELIRALISMVQSSQVIKTGICIDCLDISTTITGETMFSDQHDVNTADHFKNPLALLA